ncbi:MAG: methionine--tRNA ligase [Owenweeksia sp.]|nr:methionine--tRNA ligase [Owenweeksia sp.]MBF99402.1 methionine--tRNA ligase [Owenweeksia sp.]|tara:strand:+ start:4359 stop:6395 length:2037 start_codon:yes stop_codon:yes gene_type:complete
MSAPKRYTVTAALPYANGPVHIGHLAGCYLPADIYVRYLRQNEKDVKFICGSDEHGVAIIMKAKAEGVSPQEIVDKYNGIMQQAFEGFGISFDIYSRTSKEIHHKTASDFFLKLYEKGAFTEKETEQYYDPEAEQFLADRYIEGECPNCHFPDAYGDQCENCGTSLSPTDLINPRSRLSGAKPERRKTKHWFLPLDHLSGRIKSFIQSHKDWKPNVYGQCMSWLDDSGGLQARSMTRDLDWGIKVPLPDAEGKVLYVWFDAPIGYISATKELMGDDWETWWKDEDTALIHFIGKDNIVFHCIIFPAMLMEHGEFILPDQVPANEFLNLEGKKISTSRNWAVWLHEYLQDFPDQQDVLRYALCAAAPETKDNDFTWKDFQTRNNSELVAIYGNFVNRVLVLMQKYYNGTVPQPAAFSETDQELLQLLADAPANIGQSLDQYRFREALSAYIQLARSGNKYLADEEPWKLVKTDPERTQTILYVATQVCAALAQLGEPFLPFTSARLRSFLHLDLMSWEACKRKEFIPAGSQLEKGELLFQKIEDDKVQTQLDKLKRNPTQNNPSQKLIPLKEEITFDDFTKLDIRTGTILAAEPVPKTDKLLKLTVDIGVETRTIVSGIAEHFKPEDIIGQQVSVLANLAPKKLRGVESKGMVLMAENAEGKLVFAQPSDTMENGSVVR